MNASPAPDPSREAVVDPMSRVRFYVQHGLLEQAPTREQLARACQENAAMASSAAARFRHYLNNPHELFDRADEHRRVRLEGDVDGSLRPTQVTPPVPRVWWEQMLFQICRWSPPHFLGQRSFNAYAGMCEDGLQVPASCIIRHVLTVSHPVPIWDLQLLHAEPGGLDAFEEELGRAQRDTAPRYRAYRALAQGWDYYDLLAELVPRVRRFDYPPSTYQPGSSDYVPPHFVDLVSYLEHARSL